MKRILFTHSYFLRFDPKQWNIMQPYPPLGTITAGAYVRNAGFEVKLWDPMFAETPGEIMPVLTAFCPDVLVIYDDGFNYLTKMCLTNMREAAFEMIGTASQHGIPVIVCSSDATDNYDLYLDKGAIAVIKGEGEQTLLETIHKLEAGKGFSELQGVIYREGNKTIVNPPREVMKRLDEIPMAAWDLVNMDDYRSRWMSKHGYFSLNLSSTRGCPFKCNWCAKPIYGNRYNSRSPENVVEEIKYLQAHFDFGHIWFTDDIFGLKPGWVNRFAATLREQNVSIRYKIQCRVDLLLQENNIEALAGSGCETVWVGAESGSQKILDAMEKGTRVEQIYEATRLLKKYGIKTAFFLQFGYPGETMEDINQTVSMVKNLLPDDIGISVSYPLPGTPFYERVKSELKIKSNWTDSDELALMFSNTYPAPFYKHLHRYVHKTYRIHQGIQNLIHPNGSLSVKSTLGILYHRPGAWFHGQKMKKFSPVIPHSTMGADETGVTKAFNGLAPGYDNEFTNTVTGRVQRHAVHQFFKQNIDPLIYPNVLELNCGTGEDALWLAGKGFKVLATDVSEQMIRVATQKSFNSNQEKKPGFRVMSFNDLESPDSNKYDVIFSNFGGLNCASPAQLHTMAEKFHQLLRPGGKFIAVIMGRKCLAENLYFTLKKSPGKHRRLSRNGVVATISNESFPIWYYSPGEFAELFHPYLDLPALRPVGFFAYPSMEKLLSGSKLLANGVGLLEKTTSVFPWLSDYADHYLIEMTRT